MIRLTLVIYFVAFVINSPAQSLKWGKDYTATLESPTLGQLIPGSINNKVYVIESPVLQETFLKKFMTSLRIFNGAAKFVKEVMLSDILAKKVKAAPEKIYVADALIWENQVRVIFTAERDKKTHPIFYVQYFSESGEPINEPIQLGTVDNEKGVYYNRTNDHIRSVAYDDAQKFTYAISPDSSKFVQMEVFRDVQKKETKIYLHSFDNNFKLLSTKRLELEGPGGSSGIMNLKINDKGDLYVLARSEKTNEEMKQNKFQDFYSYRVYVSPFKSNNPFKSKTLTLSGNQYASSAEMFIDKDNEVFITGAYTNTDDKERGRYLAGYFSGSFSGYSPDIKLKPFPIPEGFFDQVHGVQKKDIRGVISLGGKIFYPPLPKQIVPVPGKGHYVIAEVDVRGIPDGFFDKNIFSGDLVVYFIDNKNGIQWFKHIPKRQEFNLAGISYCNLDNMLGFQAIVDADNRLNIVYLDRKENDMPDAITVEKKIEVIRVDRGRNDVQGLTHVQYDIAGSRTKRTYYEWPPEHEGKLLASAAMTFANNKAVFLTYKLVKRKITGLDHSEYCLVEFSL